MFIWGGISSVIWSEISWRVAVKRNFRPYNWRYASSNEHFECGYPHSNALFKIYSSKAQHFAQNWSFVSNNYVNQSQATPLMISVLRWCIAEYTDANSWCYPNRRRVTFASALEVSFNYIWHGMVAYWYFSTTSRVNLLFSSATINTFAPTIVCIRIPKSFSFIVYLMLFNQ